MISQAAPSMYARLRALSRDRALVDYEATRRALDLSKRSAFRDWQRVGDPGNPPLLNGWVAADHGKDRYPADARYGLPWYFRDNFGMIHLRGSARDPNYNGTPPYLPIFQLPADLRPEFDTYLPTHLAHWYNGDPSTFQVHDAALVIFAATGNVRLKADRGTDDMLWITFENQSFRAANAGVLV